MVFVILTACHRALVVKLKRTFFSHIRMDFLVCVYSTEGKHPLLIHITDSIIKNLLCNIKKDYLKSFMCRSY